MAFSFSVVLQWSENHPLLCLFLSVFILVWIIRSGTVRRIPNNLPPSPPKLPIIGHLHYFGALPHRSFLALSKKYGPLMLLQMGQNPTVVVSSSAVAREVLKTHDVIFSDRPVTSASKAYLFGGKDLVFAPYGEHWRQVRKLCTLELLSVKRVQYFRFIREDEIGNNMLNVIKQSCSPREQVNLSEVVLTVTTNIISRVAMSRSLGKSVYGKLAKDTMDHFGGFSIEDIFPSLRWIDVLTGLDRSMKKTAKALFQFYDEVIEERLMSRKDEDSPRDFVDLLLDHEKASTLDGVEFRREHLKAVLMNMFLAGTDTSYTTVEWTMAELVNHPDVMNKVRKEIRQVVGAKSKIDEDDIKHMNYLLCVIKESMRMHAPIPLLVPRKSTSSTTVQGYHIPAGTTVMINSWAIGRDPSNWENPDEFIPERFMNNPIDFKGLDFEFIPFGAGRRGCPGIVFGAITVETILANLLCWFDWDLPGGVKIDMAEHLGITVRLKSPLCLIPKSFP